MVSDNKLNFVLASGSPRRKELLGWLKLPIKIHPSKVEEVTDFTAPRDVVLDLAKLKGEDILSLEPENSFIVASDTLVSIGDKILGKPKTREHAREMLEMLSGNHHEVFTAVYMGVKMNGVLQTHSFVMCSDVLFAPITEDIMDLYLEDDEAMDKAGAYGIQARGLLFVESLSGSYSNVVGFPLSEFLKEMKYFLDKLGFDSNNWRNLFK